MAKASPNDGELSPEIGIPTGLNRIKTRRLRSKDSNLDETDKLIEFQSHGALRPHLKQKQRSLGQGHVKIKGSKEGFRKGKKIARWLTSHLVKDSNQAFNDIPPNTQYSESEVKELGEDGPTRTKLHKVGNNLTGKQSSPDTTCSSKVPKVLKSYSHELGPRGGIRPVHPRPHSYNDLKELLGSLRTRFDAAKEAVNAELAYFAGELMEVLRENDSLSPEGQKMTQDLFILAQECTEMTSLEFRAKCETIVQDLTEKRKQCQTGLLKWLLTRMLFILTRCTRLLHFERDSEPIDETSFHKFKKFLESVPSVEMSWIPNPGIADSGPGYALSLITDAKHELRQNQVQNLPEATWCRSEEPADKSNIISRKDFMVIEQKSLSQSSQIDMLSNVQRYHQVDEKSLGDPIIKSSCGSLHEQERSLSDSVICRICEEVVPTSHLESHSYICAYADKCDLKCSDVDERLLKLTEMLEQIIESHNSTVNASYDSPENPGMRIMNSSISSEGYSPKISEWRSKGVEGMFEDIHEMDTACIDDSHLATTINSRGHFGMKLSHCGPPSTGSMSSVSSTNTPTAGHFDFFWLEHNNPSELEDVQQMIELVDIARCVAGTDLSKEGSHEFLLACMEDLQDVLQHSKLKALIIDTFGGRIESLLREKFILACELMDAKTLNSNGRFAESSKILLDNASQNSSTSTPLHPLHKERTSIDDFEIIKPISRGAFGKVFLARKRATGDLFAIKELKKLDMIRKNDIERILAERNILITVRNPFVVRFFYSFTSRDNLYLVMEYLNGGDLYSLLKKVGCLEEDVARTYIAELVLALEYLQSLGIVHRDLKPDNILIAHDGHIKLTDFGLSKIGLMNSTGDLPGPEINGTALADSHGLHNQQTEDRSQRSAVGTPDYLAPEILLGTEHGYAADWWSVGIILFEFICGIPPFNAELPEIIFDNILNRKIPWPSVPKDMSYEAQDLIDRFLVHDPDQRLGAKGSSEVKAHPFFRGVNWDTLALQKAAFVPNPDGLDDTSYFVSRYTQFSTSMADDDDTSDSDSVISDSSNSGLEKMDECGDLAAFDPSLDLSLMNFSFKNLSQLASINRDVLLQSWKGSSSSSPSKSPNR
ncbi:probable serine/threonine protein kinase IRE4 isoform X2 [Cornus florida]|uniref:probable serine/threonine protein kinase IRE4 isoform X2 n=1 Tax=Cornus florida TaxID=4283 RepID=UPI002898EB62|nr:probable serine/threonine protein kinase IRE4 isoform X2 [Cornus florida]